MSTLVDHHRPAAVAVADPANGSSRELAAIAAIASELARSPLAWSHLVQSGAKERWYARIARTAELDAWLIGWPPGCGVPLHDHGGSSGVCCVVDGRIVESVASRVESSPLEMRVLGAGAIATFAGDHVHGMVNLDDQPALSVHVYAPVLRSMQFFRTDGGELVASHHEAVSDDSRASR